MGGGLGRGMGQGGCERRIEVFGKIHKKKISGGGGGMGGGGWEGRGSGGGGGRVGLNIFIHINENKHINKQYIIMVYDGSGWWGGQGGCERNVGGRG